MQEEYELTEQERAEIDQIVEEQAQIVKCVNALEQIGICCTTALEGEITDADLIETLLDAREQLLEHSPDREKGSKFKEMYLKRLDDVNGTIGDIACDYLASSAVKDEKLKKLLDFCDACEFTGSSRFYELVCKGLGIDGSIRDEERPDEAIMEAKKEAWREAWINKN